MRHTRIDSSFGALAKFLAPFYGACMLLSAHYDILHILIATVARPAARIQAAATPHSRLEAVMIFHTVAISLWRITCQPARVSLEASLIGAGRSHDRGRH